jgi:hypothetical protein
MSSNQSTPIDLTAATLLDPKKDVMWLGLQQYGINFHNPMDIHTEECPYCTDSAFQNAHKEGAMDLIEPRLMDSLSINLRPYSLHTQPQGTFSIRFRMLLISRWECYSVS